MAVAQVSAPPRDGSPRADTRAALRDPVTAARLLPIAYLTITLVARCTGTAWGTTDFRYLPFVVALFPLPLWYASGLARRPWERAPYALLAAQAALTYVPFAVFGSAWIGGSSALFIGMILLVVRPPVSWWVALALLAVEGVLWNVVLAAPYLPAVNAGFWVMAATTDNALGLFGVVRLASVVRDLAAAQDELTKESILRERLAVGERLTIAIEDRIQFVARHARAALRWLSTTPEDARNEVVAAGRIARAALLEGRRIYADDGDRIGVDVERTDTAPTRAVARAVLATVLVACSTLNLVNVLAPDEYLTGRHYDRPTAFAVAVFVSMAVPLLHWNHSGTTRGGDRPRYWPVSLAALAVLCYVQCPLLGTEGLQFVGFLAASLLLLVPGPWRWAWFAAATLSIPVVAWWTDAGSTGSSLRYTATWQLWIAAWASAALVLGLMSYGLSRFAGLADRLTTRREQVAALAGVAERLRLARDTHDLLGLGMSTLALKADLAAALIGRDDQRAGRELGELVNLCATVSADAGRITGERPQLSLASEFPTAAAVLAASGIDVSTDRADVRLTPEADTVLAIVLREAVTNILRHSAAQRCAITLAAEAGAVTLRVSNDGAAAPSTPDTAGHGLDNMRARVEALRGSLATRYGNGTFVVIAQLARNVG